ncbi:MAG TPA: phosphoribosylglycinamide synthetase C domain-containing protein, partial [Bacteroidota bacterium]|nr:phosphoribosylglycinamide synthetase C domain-containing protein [Bacteroidota bacterium]
IAALLYEVATRTLISKVVVGKRTAVCVVMASGGYPDKYESGKPIMGLDAVAKEKGVVVFHAGTKATTDGVLTAGGRVLGVTAVAGGAELSEAISLAYRAVGEITFDGAYYRSDIGKKGLNALQGQTETEG